MDHDVSPYGNQIAGICARARSESKVSVANMEVVSYHMHMNEHPRITRDTAVMGGKPCIRGMRITVGTVTGLVAARHSWQDILRMYPYLEPDDITAALSYATWLAEAYESDLQPA
jgi:uncharacterized protein (DUF433 family)